LRLGCRGGGSSQQSDCYGAAGAKAGIGPVESLVRIDDDGCLRRNRENGWRIEPRVCGRRGQKSTRDHDRNYAADTPAKLGRNPHDVLSFLATARCGPGEAKVAQAA
jgi:hypothetical protein